MKLRKTLISLQENKIQLLLGEIGDKEVQIDKLNLKTVTELLDWKSRTLS